MWLKRIIYRVGIRPSQGTIWFSPSLAFIYAAEEFMKRRRNEEKGSQ